MFYHCYLIKSKLVMYLPCSSICPIIYYLISITEQLGINTDRAEYGAPVRRRFLRTSSKLGGPPGECRGRRVAVYELNTLYLLYFASICELILRSVTKCVGRPINDFFFERWLCLVLLLARSQYC